jgi:hypothetical protein
MTDAATISTNAPRSQVRRRYDGAAKSPQVPHTAFLRELTMPDGRKILIDKRAIAFFCEGKSEEFSGKKVTIVAFKGWAKPVPVVEGYHDLKAWWRSDGRGQV